MPLLTRSPAARTALIYVTIGALTIVWTGVWAVYLWNNAPASTGVYYWCTGFAVTGIALLGLGLGLGRLGRSARSAELPPAEVTAAVADAEQNASRRPVQIAPATPGIAAIPMGVPAVPAPVTRNGPALSNESPLNART